MRLLDMIPDCDSSASPMLNGQEPLNFETQMTLTLEEMEEEYSMMMRWYESLLEQGKSRQAEELMEKIQELEGQIADAEEDLAHPSAYE